MTSTTRTSRTIPVGGTGGTGPGGGLGRTAALGLALTGCLAAVAAHVLVLRASGQDPVTSPIGLLSTTPQGAWHGAGIGAFALAHLALAWLLGANPTGPLHAVARVALVLAAAALAARSRHSRAPPIPPLECRPCDPPAWQGATPRVPRATA